MLNSNYFIRTKQEISIYKYAPAVYERRLLMEQKKNIKAEYEKLSLTDNFIFGKIMQDERNCIDMLERLTGNHIESVKTVVNQKTIQVTNDSKGIRYDVYVEDDNEIMYDAEMQNRGSGKDTNIHVLSKRVRAYQGLMDINSLENGGSYKELRNSYIIFICTFEFVNLFFI